MVELIIKGILIALAAVLDSEKDTIVYKPQSAWFSSEWWLEQNYLVRRLAGKSVWLWLVRYPFSFLINGWHFCKSLSLLCLMLAMFPIGEYYLAVLGYILYGLVFNLFYHKVQISQFSICIRVNMCRFFGFGERGEGGGLFYLIKLKTILLLSIIYYSIIYFM